MDKDWRDQVAAAVRGVDLITLYGRNGCFFRAEMGRRALTHLGMQPRVMMGSVTYRVGPHEVFDVVRFSGPGNIALIPGLYHVWLELEGHIVDFSCGDWHVNERSTAEAVPADYDGELPPITWQIEPPEYVWRPAQELTAPWKPDGVPELGGMWYRAGVRTEDSGRGRDAVQAYFDEGVMQAQEHVSVLWPAVEMALPEPLPRPPGRAEARRLRQMQKRAANAAV
jgi:hypothetical protein